MGFPNHLRGKSEKRGDESNGCTCPKCKNEIFVFRIVKQGNEVKKLCPYCGYEFKNGNQS